MRQKFIKNTIYFQDAIEEDEGQLDDEDESTSELDEEEYDEDDEDYDNYDEEFKSSGDPFAGIAGILDAIELGEDDDVELIA